MKVWRKMYCHVKSSCLYKNTVSFGPHFFFSCHVSSLLLQSQAIWSLVFPKMLTQVAKTSCCVRSGHGQAHKSPEHTS